MQDVDGPADIETLALPAGAGRSRVQVETGREMLRAQGLDRISKDGGRRWHLGQEPTIWSAEAKRAVRLSIDLIALLVDGAVMPATLCRLRFYAAFGLGSEGAVIRTRHNQSASRNARSRSAGR